MREATCARVFTSYVSQITSSAMLNPSDPSDRSVAQRFDQPQHLLAVGDRRHVCSGDLTLQHRRAAWCVAAAARLDCHADALIVRERLVRADQYPAVALAGLKHATAVVLAITYKPDLEDLIV